MQGGNDAQSFGRLKKLVEFTDYHQLTNQQLEDLLNNTRTEITQFSIDFSKLFSLP
jgi:hypothetical protein